MKNDYKRNDFAEIVIDGERKFYIKINNKWIQVPREVFRVCKNSYIKILNDNQRDSDMLEHYDDVDNIYPFIIDKNTLDLIDNLYKKEKHEQILNLLQTLSREERDIIQWIYFDFLTEQEVAIRLHTTRLKINYKKRKILKKLHKLLTTL